MSQNTEITELIQKCLDTPDFINELSDTDIKNISSNISIYGSINHEPANKFTCCSITNLRETYMKRILMVGIVGYIFRSLKEYNIDNSIKDEIHTFLLHLFDFNPDYHVTHSSNKSSTNTNTNTNISTNHMDGSNIPIDTFFRMDKYFQVNYENVRNLVETIYHEKPDFDYIINIYDSFTNEEEANTFVKKHQQEFIHDVLTIKNNNWTFLGPFNKNRDKIDFYNENTEELESILKQVEQDQRIGKKLLEKRVTNEKRVNIRNQGEHSKDLKTDSSIVNEKDANDMEKLDDPFLRVDVLENDGLNLRKSHFYTEAVKPTKEV